MFREHWREPRFWLWWVSKGAPAVVRWSLGVLGVVAVLGGGFLAADRLSQANAGISPTSEFTFVTTIERNVTVREHGKIIVRRVPVIRRVLVRPVTNFETRFETRVVKTPGGIRIVTHPVVRYVPVVKKTTITVAGKKRVVTKTVLVPTVRTETSTITNQQTVVNQNTSTVVTVVVTTLPVTVKQTTTQSTTIVTTQTLPGQTVTTTHTVTQPVTVTQPAVTVTLPATTVTITVPGTGT